LDEIEWLGRTKRRLIVFKNEDIEKIYIF